MAQVDILNAAIIVFGIYGGCKYIWDGLRANVPDPDDDRFTRAANARDRGASGLPDFVVAAVFLVTACVQFFHPLPVAAVYAILCLVLAFRLIAGLLVEERERSRRRRAALLQRSPRVEGVLAVWIGLAATSTVLLLPSLTAGPDRISAFLVAGCCVAMAVVAWRIATAPALLSGDDVEAELLLDRTRRIRRTGLVCMVAVGSVFFLAISAGEPRNFGYTGIFVWVVLGAWLIVYLRHLYRTPLPS